VGGGSIGDSVSLSVLLICTLSENQPVPFNARPRDSQLLQWHPAKPRWSNRSEFDPSLERDHARSWILNT